jgi:inhibitor of KinA sporulation pathway (predicted exonuclease)
MKFYLDFEANQFSERIISIGCVAENGMTFNSLVNPGKGEKITGFITKLTGITQEMADVANSADEVFVNFANWVVNASLYSEDPHPKYYVYGSNDAGFLQRTINHMTNPMAISFATSVKALMTDYSKTVKSHFKVGQIGLNRVYQLLKDEDHMQKHDALEDAMMLKYVQEHLCDVVEEDAVNLPPVQKKSHVNKDEPATAEEQERYKTWGKAKRLVVDTDADENNWVIRCEFNDGNGNPQQKHFGSIRIAAFWAIKYMTKHRFKITNGVHIRDVRCGIELSMKSNEDGNPNLKYAKCFWYKNTNGENEND